MGQKLQGEASDRRLAPLLPTNTVLGMTTTLGFASLDSPTHMENIIQLLKMIKKRETSEFLRKQTGELTFTACFNASFILNRTPQSLPRKTSMF